MSRLLGVALSAALTVGAGAALVVDSAHRVPAQAAEAVQAAPQVQLKVSWTRKAGKPVVVATGTAPAPAKRRVLVQRLSGKRWVNVARIRTTTKRAFSASVTLPAGYTGTTSWRAVAPAVRGARPAKQAVSAVWRLRITAGQPPAGGGAGQEVPGETPGKKGSPGNPTPSPSASAKPQPKPSASAAPTPSKPFDPSAYPAPGLKPGTYRVAGGNGRSSTPTVSVSGRYVAFSSAASDLVAGDTNARNDVFVKDLTSGALQRLANGTAVGDQPVISGDGRYVAFRTYQTDGRGNVVGPMSVALRDRQGTTTQLLTRGTGTSGSPSISADGQLVAYSSDAADLAAGDTNGLDDVFLYNAKTGVTRAITQGNDSSYGASISADGRYVAFVSYATNLAPGPDTADSGDVFVFDTASGTTTRLVHLNADCFNVVISADGRFVTFSTPATDAPGADGASSPTYRLEVRTGALLNVQAASAIGVGVSTDGSSVAFVSSADGLVPSDTNGMSDLFVRDLSKSATAKISAGDEGAVDVAAPAMSTLGTVFTFASASSTITPDDTNGQADIFVVVR